MRTVTLQIGNTDDKLLQREWSTFVAMVRDLLRDTPTVTVHFFGCSFGGEPWQNACWVFVVDEGYIPQTTRELTVIRSKFHQDSVAWTEGETSFI